MNHMVMHGKCLCLIYTCSWVLIYVLCKSHDFHMSLLRNSLLRILYNTMAQLVQYTLWPLYQGKYHVPNTAEQTSKWKTTQLNILSRIVLLVIYIPQCTGDGPNLKLNTPGLWESLNICHWICFVDSDPTSSYIQRGQIMLSCIQVTQE